MLGIISAKPATVPDRLPTQSVNLPTFAGWLYWIKSDKKEKQQTDF